MTKAHKPRKRTKNFMPVKRPGAATAAAKREGLSLSAWSRKHYHDSGKVGGEARFVQIRKKWKTGGKRSKKRS
jgi:hypothetical protein